MSNKLLCPACHGRGKVLGNGFMQQTCKYCTGIGYSKKAQEKLITKQVAKQAKQAKKHTKRTKDDIDLANVFSTDDNELVSTSK